MAHLYANYCNNYNKNPGTDENVGYKKKYKKLKKLVKDTVFENAALCDQVAQTQENLVIAKEERLFLLKKLLHFQGDSQDPSLLSNRLQLTHLNNININSDVSGSKKSTKKKNSLENSSCSGEITPKSKAKRSNKATRRLVQLIPLDIHGRPLFPISLGDLTVYSLGEVVSDRINYHTDDVIYPVGFCSTRLYASLKDVHSQSLYTCKILDGGPRPRFEIVSDTDLDQPLVGSSPDECHSRLLIAISPIPGNIMPRGACFFGLSHPTIQNLIQSSPGTRKLVLYKPQKFEVSKNLVNENGFNPISEEENDPSISFTALHRAFALNSGYGIKQEPMEQELCTVQDLA